MTELIEYLENKIENCESLGMPKEKWAFIQTLKKVRELQSLQSCVSGCYVGTQTPIERLRNKLTPFLTLIDLLESNENMVLPFIDDTELANKKNELFEQCLDTCIKYKKDIKIHLSDCEGFYNNH